MDNFYEQFVGRKDSKFYNFINVLVYGFCIIALLFFAIAKVFAFIVFFIIGSGIFLAKKKLYTEYEYSFTNGEIDIDKITDRSNRKSVANFNINDIEIMAKADSDIIKNGNFSYEKELNFYVNHNKGAVYSIYVACNKGKLKINFVPDKEFVDLCYLLNPRKVNK
ncbi:DUF6106 family protein [Clostridium pasteurianum]|uniref:DUF6106 family protein n=1 Tax=Clostridium pasteurianum TaxID=1501 RepID=UPI002260ED28|nr:DUF6106 family protein [Clostridium pasteurianum]UZW15585.1 DUF6106 family protein [Clostridium pasteurianum]